MTQKYIANTRKARQPGEHHEPLSLTPDIAEKIISGTLEGHGITTLANKYGILERKIWRWIYDETYLDTPILTSFRERYQQARRIRAHKLIDQSLDIADDSRNDWIEHHARSGETTLRPNQELVNRSRLRIEMRKWLAAKDNPEAYGDNQNLNVGIQLAMLVQGVNAAVENNPTPNANVPPIPPPPPPTFFFSSSDSDLAARAGDPPQVVEAEFTAIDGEPVATTADNSSAASAAQPSDIAGVGPKTWAENDREIGDPNDIRSDV